MRSRRLFIGFMLAALVPLGAASPGVPGPVPEASWVRGGDLRLHLRIFRGDKPSKSPILVIVLHGDAPRKRPGQQDAFAARAAEGLDGVAVGLLRPGYTDLQGNTSEGEKGRMNGDNYDARRTDAIASAIGVLKRRLHARKVVLAGHSGGAALAANILGRHPTLADAALLVSCPCDVPAWRESMFQLTKRPEFRDRIETLSPLDMVEGLSPTVEVTLVVGTQDLMTPPGLSERYQAAAAKLRKKVRLVRLANRGHDFFLDPAVHAELNRLIKRTRPPGP